MGGNAAVGEGSDIRAHRVPAPPQNIMKRSHKHLSHAEAVKRVREFQRQVREGEYKRAGVKPLTSEEVTQVEMLTKVRTDFAVIPPECMEAWGRKNRWGLLD